MLQHYTLRILRNTSTTVDLFIQRQIAYVSRTRLRSAGVYYPKSLSILSSAQRILKRVEFLSSKITMRQHSSMVLYGTELSPPSRSVTMVMDILGLDIERRNLNPVIREQDEPEYVKKNPMRTIPILEEGDFCLSDSHAIIIYLMEKYAKPEHAHLYPADKRKRATIHQRMFLDCGIIFPRLRAIMAPTYGGRLTELSKFMIKNTEDAYKMLEDYLSETLYLADNMMTIADLSVITTVSTLSFLVPVDENRFPKLKQWLKTMSEVDVCKRINEDNAKMHAKSILMVIEHNKENQKAKL